GSVAIPAGAVRAFLAPLPVGLLRARVAELAELPQTLERLGIRTLGELAALPAPAVAERFGHPGLLALDLAQGRDSRLEPRRPPPRSRSPSRSRPSDRRRRTRDGSWRTARRRPSGSPASPRRSGRCARPRGRTPRFASSRSIPTRGCRSGARRWPRSRRRR